MTHKFINEHNFPLIWFEEISLQSITWQVNNLFTCVFDSRNGLKEDSSKLGWRKIISKQLWVWSTARVQYWLIEPLLKLTHILLSLLNSWTLSLWLLYIPEYVLHLCRVWALYSCTLHNVSCSGLISHTSLTI